MRTRDGRLPWRRLPGGERKAGADNDGVSSVQGTRIAVYFLWMTAHDYAFDAPRVAEHFSWPFWKVECALAYADTFRDEISRLVDEHRELDDEAALRRILPSLRVSEV